MYVTSDLLETNIKIGVSFCEQFSIHEVILKTVYFISMYMSASQTHAQNSINPKWDKTTLNSHRHTGFLLENV